jgi:hypothetical protein
MTATIINLAEARKARGGNLPPLAAPRRRKKVRQVAAPLPPPRELTPLDILNRIAVKLGLPALPPEDAH